MQISAYSQTDNQTAPLDSQTAPFVDIPCTSNPLKFKYSIIFKLKTPF